MLKKIVVASVLICGLSVPQTQAFFSKKFALGAVAYILAKETISRVFDVPGSPLERACKRTDKTKEETEAFRKNVCSKISHFADYFFIFKILYPAFGSSQSSNSQASNQTS